MPKPLSIQEFFRQFPDDDACLAHLFKIRFGDNPACPRCGEIGKFRRLSKMPAWTCNCGNHLHPMVDTPFERSRTPLQKWFFAIFMFTTTRNGVAAKELQRALGVTYKTAWRMAWLIREYMGTVDGDAPLGPGGGIVEADKAFIGGVDHGSKNPVGDKAIVLGMVERGGEAITRVIPNRSTEAIHPHILRKVRAGSRLATDSAVAFRELGRLGYQHEMVNHSAEEYARGQWHTNTVEAFWAMAKRTIGGTHVWVSPKYLQVYLREIEFRWNLRQRQDLMFPVLVSAFHRSPWHG